MTLPGRAVMKRYSVCFYLGTVKSGQIFRRSQLSLRLARPSSRTCLNPCIRSGSEGVRNGFCKHPKSTSDRSGSVQASHMTRVLVYAMRRWRPTELCCLVCRQSPSIITRTSARDPHPLPMKPRPLNTTAAAAATRASGACRRATLAVMSLVMGRR